MLAVAGVHQLIFPTITKNKMEITNPINWCSDIWSVEDKHRILNNLLSLYCCKVDFQKLNGEHRSMRCTLRQDLLPANVQNQQQHQQTLKIGTIRVWLPEEQVWRSFKVENVYNVEVD